MMVLATSPWVRTAGMCHASIFLHHRSGGGCGADLHPHLRGDPEHHPGIQFLSGRHCADHGDDLRSDALYFPAAGQPPAGAGQNRQSLRPRRSQCPCPAAGQAARGRHWQVPSMPRINIPTDIRYVLQSIRRCLEVK